MARRVSTRSKAAKAAKKRRRGTGSSISASAKLKKQLDQRSHEVAALRRQLAEALDQQGAANDVLKAISHSAFDLQTVLDTLVESATRLCEADHAWLFQLDGEGFLHFVASYGHRADEHKKMSDYFNTHRASADRGSVAGRVLLGGKVVHIPDVLADVEYTWHAAQQIGGYRTALGAPLLRDGQVGGVIFLYRTAPRPFTSKQIELVTSFAAQAVIAIENTRLLNELRESLQQQTATADVLKVISSSPGDLEPVFQAMLENAVRLCDAKFGALLRFDGEEFHVAAGVRIPPELAEVLNRPGPFQGVSGGIVDRLRRTKQVVHSADSSTSAIPGLAAKFGGARSIVGVPMLKDSQLVGAIVIYRQEVRPFTEKQIELLTNFAAQAVIAIENTRLLSELRVSLDRQTATANILRVIASSPGEVEGSLREIAETTARLFGAVGASFRIAEGDALKLSVGVGQGAEQLSSSLYADPAIRPTVGGRNLPGTVIRENRQIHLSDLDRLDDEFADWPGPPVARRAGIRTMVGTPLRIKGRAIGALMVYRNVLQPFETAELQLLQSFADQAVIAIENARLLNELRQSLEQQTATSEVLKVISSSPGDLEPAFNAMLENATRICEAKFGFLWLYDGQRFRLGAAGQLVEREFAKFARENPPKLNRQSLAGRAVLEKRTVHIHDVLEDVDYRWQGDEGARVGNFRTVLGVPLMREGTPLGAFSLARTEVRPFTEKQIELVTNFAAQAVIAIENARLLNELRQRTSDLSRSLDDLQTAQDRLVQTQKLASLGQLTAGIAHEIKNPLNFVNNFSSLSTELLDELREALQNLPIDGKARTEIDELTETLRANLNKIEQHGKRADSIVKNMLLHSREGSGEHRLIDINAVVEESLNLAYHGARAEKQDFNITLERSFDPAAGEVDVFPQDITRVLLNLISNGFYAANKRKIQTQDDYEPVLSATTKSLGDRVEIRIRDNGTGIPAEVKEKMFNPFFTTKPPGEGTGLGLSLSYDIIVKQHAGAIEVDTEPGRFTEFRIILPRTAALIAKTGGRA